MRFPFDLIAIMLGWESISSGGGTHLPDVSWREFIENWAGFFLLVWLMSELMVRVTEWNTRWGRNLTGVSQPGRKTVHPIESYQWHNRAVQALSVVLYLLVCYNLNWPEKVSHWPEWLGFAGDRQIGQLYLSQSSAASMLLALPPYLLATMFSWLAKSRISGSLRRGNFIQALTFEAKLTWLPLALWLFASVLSDVATALPKEQTAWMNNPGIGVLLPVLSLGFLTMVAFPLAVVKLWGCRPFPEGPLKDRLLALMKRSGVKARALMLWGPRGTGFMNACVLGPWAPLRYVLVSPALIDALSEDELEAVLGHELGHARHGHLTALFFIVLLLSALLEPVAGFLHNTLGLPSAEQAAVLMVFIIGYMYLFFGAVMRLCEREADLAAAELTGTPVHLAGALETLGRLSGEIRTVNCWHHGSIAQRVNALNQLSLDPPSQARLHDRLKLMRAGIALLAIGALVLAAFYKAA